MKKKTKQKVVDVVIDADSIPYTIAPTLIPKKDSLEGVAIKVQKTKLKVLKKDFKELVEDFQAAVEVECAIRGWKLGEVKLIFSDPDGNFRYDIYPEYKANRAGQERTKDFYKIRAWALKKYGYAKQAEADDEVAHHVRNGAIGISIDKDLLYGVEGLWFNCHYKHRDWVLTTKEQAKKFNYHQTLAGDLTDNIKGINRVGLVTAETLLDGDYSWGKVIEIYEKKGLTEDDAILTRRLIGMDQWSPEDGVKLWKPSKKDKKSVKKMRKAKDAVTTAPEKSSKTNKKDVEEKETVPVKRRTTKRKDTKLPAGDKGLQESTGDNAKKRYSGYYKSSYLHKDLITESTYNKLSPNAKREYSRLEV